VSELFITPVPPAASSSQADADAAIAVLEKGKTVNP